MLASGEDQLLKLRQLEDEYRNLTASYDFINDVTLKDLRGDVENLQREVLSKTLARDEAVQRAERLDQQVKAAGNTSDLEKLVNEKQNQINTLQAKNSQVEAQSLNIAQTLNQQYTVVSDMSAYISELQSINKDLMKQIADKKAL